MTDIGVRVQRAIAELTGNESLMGMLESDAANELLNWGIRISTSIVNETDGLDDFLADKSLLPRLKAVRVSMRSLGNWAAGKYVEPQSRIDLRDKLLEQFKIIYVENVQSPSAEAMDELLNQVDDKSNTPHHLISNMMQLLADQNKGEL